MSQRKTISVALAGNPNSGKTSIFNALTGAHQHVGNYPGVTVEKKEGVCRFGEQEYRVVDLPGIYSMTSYSVEEVVARRFLVEEKPSVVINVVDATNLERNLYLTIQLLEMGLNLVMALNMMDELDKTGVVLDVDMIGRRLGCPVVRTVGIRNEGIEDLKQTVFDAHVRGQTDAVIIYRDELGTEVKKLTALMEHLDAIPYPKQFAAVKMLEKDTEVLGRFRRMSASEPLFTQLNRSVQRLETLYGYPPEVMIGDRRYGFASGLVKEVTVTRPMIDRITLTEKIDSVVTSRILGFPLFLLSIYLIFWLTFSLGSWPMQWIETGFEKLARAIESQWPAGGSMEWLQSLIVDGIIGGVGGVLVFLPNILLLFMGISFLEDTGYMSRIAFIMDKIMHKIGLHGRSFIPLIIGFGCTVPAILATRTIRSEKTRLTTMMILPLMSCGARLPIYLMIIPAFYPQHWQAPVLWSMYMIGVLLAMVVAKLLRETLFKGEAEPFVMELPPYRMPALRMVMMHMWEKAWQYFKKAGTIILGVSILVWALLSYPVAPERNGSVSGRDQLEYSFAGRFGHFIEPVLNPMGFDWRIGTSFIGAFAAKELFVAQMGVVFSLEEAREDSAGGETLRDILRKTYSPLVGFCIMLFALVATPCMATLIVTWKEAGSIRWALFQWIFLTATGWLLTTAVYQFARIFLH
ncbi:ferrous iron transport protein B [bacterium]|nr:ferrous iron transport protein B [candidate division CSSED10-310 bacterium]